MRALLLAGWTAVAALLGAAQHSPSPPLPPIRWGLWENTVKGMPGMDDRTWVTRSCVSAVTWKGFMDTHGNDSGHCVWSNQKATATTYSADMSCADGKITGHGEMTIDSPESLHSTMSIDVTESQGKTSHFNGTVKSRFFSTSCLGLKPGEEIDVWE